MARLRRLLASLLLLCAGCGGDGETDAPISPPFEPLRTVATHNVGTTLFLAMKAESPQRQVCDEWYVDDLCTLDTEATVAAALVRERPDVLMLQEVWDQARCAEEGRPDLVGEPPYVCSAGDGHQLLRVLPDGYRFACASARRDSQTCVAWRPGVFAPGDGETDGCEERDCTAWLTPLETECTRGGRLAWLRGESELGPTALVVVHPKAGFKDTDIECRARQLGELSEEIEGFAADGALLVAGDFNLNPDGEPGPDVLALRALLDAHGLTRLPATGFTHQILEMQLDLVLTRGWPPAAEARCAVELLDADAEVTMLDHAFVVCR